MVFITEFTLPGYPSKRGRKITSIEESVSVSDSVSVSTLSLTSNSVPRNHTRESILRELKDNIRGVPIEVLIEVKICLKRSREEYELGWNKRVKNINKNINKNIIFNPIPEEVSLDLWLDSLLSKFDTINSPVETLTHNSPVPPSDHLSFLEHPTLEA